MNQDEQQICDDLVKSSILDNEENIKCYLWSAKALPLTNDPNVLIIMLDCLNDVEAGEVQYELLEAMERFPDDIYVKTVMPRIKDVIAKSGEWGWMLFQSILNSESCLNIAIEIYKNFPPLQKKEIDLILNQLCARDFQYNKIRQLFNQS